MYTSVFWLHQQTNNSSILKGRQYAETRVFRDCIAEILIHAISQEEILNNRVVCNCHQRFETLRSWGNRSTKFQFFAQVQ